MRWRHVIFLTFVVVLSIGFSLPIFAADSPVLNRATTNGDGTAIILNFDKEMANPDGRHNQFSFEVDESVRSFSAITLQEGNPTKIRLTVDGIPISKTDEVTVSYIAGDVEALDSGVLTSFADVSVINAVFESGTGDSGNPYVIINGDQLDAVRYHLSKAYELGLDIDLNGSPYNAGAGWEPIGVFSGTPFTGIFDGNGYTVSNLYINRSDMSYVGLFGYVGYGAGIDDLGLTGINVTGYDSVGALVGRSLGTITQSYAIGTVSGNRNGVGGLAGANFGSISDSYAQVDVSGGQFIGGLAGSNNGTISYSYAEGGVQGAEYLGGLTGWSSGVIVGSYATGAVDGTGMYIGGLVGRNIDEISNSYAEGNVEGTNRVGGLVGENGWNTSIGIIENSYATGDVRATNSRVGGLVGAMQLTDSVVTESFATGNVTGGQLTGGLVGQIMGGTVSNSYALNTEILRTAVSASTNFGRIVGENSGTLSGNWANFEMTEPFVGTFTAKTGDGKDGADLYDWSINNGTLMVDASSILTNDPESPEENQNFTFMAQVRDVWDNPVSGLNTGDFNINENGAGSLTLVSIVEDGATGNYTVTASHDTAETITITVYVLGVEAGSIENLVIQDATPAEPEAGAELRAWGWNGYGQLGDDSTVDRHDPTQIGEDWDAVVAGKRHTVALKADGSLWAWGRNNYGQLGDNTIEDKDVPTRIGIDSDWAAVSAGDEHTVALKTDGSLWAWGSNGFDQLGDNATEGEDTPRCIGGDSNWSAVSAGGRHTVALKTDGSLWAWGYNSSGQLGQGNDLNVYTTPMRIGGDSNWEAVSAGNAHTLALKADGSLWAWGNNQYGQLGVGDMYVNKHTPTRIGEDSDWATVSTGYGHTLALKADGSLWAWGYNNSGQLGGTTEHSDTPTHIGEAENWAVVSAGSYHTAALKTDGSLWAWGNNSNGELGDGTTEERDTATLIDDDRNWMAVSAGGGHTVALAEPEAPPIASDLEIVSSSLTNGTEDQAYSHTFTALGGTPPYGFALNSGSLPSGLSLTSNGELSGTPTESGTFSFTIEVVDNALNTDSSTFTLTINEKSTSGGGGGSRRSTPSTPEPTVNATLKTGNYEASYEVNINESKDSTTVSLSKDAIDDAFGASEADDDDMKTVSIEVPVVEGTNDYILEVPAEALSQNHSNRMIQMSSEVGDITLPSNMLTGTGHESSGDVSISMGNADSSKLPEDVQDLIGDRPVIELKLMAGNETIDWNNSDAPVEVSIPYTPTAEELADPEHIVIWYIDGQGNAVEVPSGRYDPETGKVTFSTTHFSDYAVGYNLCTFVDIEGVAWAKNQIKVLASKGILREVSENKYIPTADITRADFLYFLVRTLGVDAKINQNFEDIPENAYYFKEIGIAKELGITKGTGDNQFNPDEPITRQDMMVLTERTLKMLKIIEGQNIGLALDDFADKHLAADYAVNSMATLVNEGLIQGDGDKINPLGNTTRAEAAVFLYRIYNK